MKKEDFILLTRKGVAGHGDMEDDDILAALLNAYLEIWNMTKCEIDIVEAADRMLDALAKYCYGEEGEEDGVDDEDEEPTFADLLDYLLEDDD